MDDHYWALDVESCLRRLGPSYALRCDHLGRFIVETYRFRRGEHHIIHVSLEATALDACIEAERKINAGWNVPEDAA